MKTYTITESKAQLSALVQQVEETGEPIVIGRNGRPTVQLTRYRPRTKKRRLDVYAGKIHLAEDFKDWGQEEASAFGLK